MTDRQPERLLQLERALAEGQPVCTSAGMLDDFPPSLKRAASLNGLGLIVCHEGHFGFALNNRHFAARAGETLFIPEDAVFQVLHASDDVQVYILVYQTAPIRDIMGNMVVSMYLHSQLMPDPCYVWRTGSEAEVIHYMSLLDSTLQTPHDSYNRYEQQLLLLALTHRLCAIYNRRLTHSLDREAGAPNEAFIRLVRLIEQHYMEERGVRFYADRLCLSPKYLSALCKSICGYTVQELVFKSITRKSISLLKNTQKNVQEIADALHFPNASYFGTFFKKQTGMSPQQFRRSEHRHSS